MELTPENVETVLLDCLYAEEPDDVSEPIIVTGLTFKLAFDPAKIQSHLLEIHSMLMQLPDDFMASGGGGMTFLAMNVRNDGVQWGQHRDMEKLVLLGLAINMITFPLPREYWPSLPGNVPYILIKDVEIVLN